MQGFIFVKEECARVCICQGSCARVYTFFKEVVQGFIFVKEVVQGFICFSRKLCKGLCLSRKLYRVFVCQGSCARFYVLIVKEVLQIQEYFSGTYFSK